MEYRFIAEMKDGRKITLCEWDKKELFESIMNQIIESDYILRFAIEKNNDIIKERYLDVKGKEKSLCLRKD